MPQSALPEMAATLDRTGKVETPKQKALAQRALMTSIQVPSQATTCRALPGVAATLDRTGKVEAPKHKGSVCHAQQDNTQL